MHTLEELEQNQLSDLEKLTPQEAYILGAKHSNLGHSKSYNPYRNRNCTFLWSAWNEGWSHSTERRTRGR